MHEKLIAYINSRLANRLTDEEQEIVRTAFSYKKLRKHQYLLQEGEVCKTAGFIISGAIKQYTVDDSGKEDVLGLYIENWWAGDRESFMNGTPSQYFFDAFEETEMLVVNRDSFFQSLGSQRFMADLMRSLTEKQSLQLLKRVHTTKTMTAEMRLADLEKTYPELLQRFPQHLIASYLGMTKETLSRIRGNYQKK